jgi:hypothetical protein
MLVVHAHVLQAHISINVSTDNPALALLLGRRPWLYCHHTNALFCCCVVQYHQASRQVDQCPERQEDLLIFLLYHTPWTWNMLKYLFNFAHVYLPRIDYQLIYDITSWLGDRESCMCAGVPFRQFFASFIRTYIAFSSVNNVQCQ